MNEKGCTLGRAVRLLAQNSAAAAQDWTESSVLRRFNALATADSMPEVSHYLRGMVQLFRGNEPKLKLDYPRLAVELYRFQLPDQAANVRLQWGRDLYQMNADTPETEEKEIYLPVGKWSVRIFDETAGTEHLFFAKEKIKIPPLSAVAMIK